MKAINKKFTSSIACGQLRDQFMQWASDNLPDVEHDTSVYRPYSPIPSDSWSPPYEWEKLAKSYQDITGEVCNTDTIAITVGKGWRSVMTAIFDDTVIFKGIYELLVEIDDEYLAVQCRLAMP
jgi:hypothetical protein